MAGNGICRYQERPIASSQAGASFVFLRVVKVLAGEVAEAIEAGVPPRGPATRRPATIEEAAALKREKARGASLGGCGHGLASVRPIMPNRTVIHINTTRPAN
jgi:hypothetical protein